MDTHHVILSHMCPAAAERRLSSSADAGAAEQPAQANAGQQQQEQENGQKDHPMPDASGPDLDSTQQQQQQQQGVANAAAAAAAAGADGSMSGGDDGGGSSGGAAGGLGDAPGASTSCAREASIMRQTQVALTTWRHLQSTASTPSTVMQGGAGGVVQHATETARTASSAVQ